jgi:hypothetical protein
MISFSGWGAFLWFTGTQLLPEDVGFGYYRDFHIARKAIEESPCAEWIEYSRHEDLTLEDFHFQIRTQSGLIVRLWFYEGMDVRQVCFQPRGLVVVHPRSQSICQRYVADELPTQLNGKSIKGTNLNDVLCNLDQLALFFQANYDNEAIRRVPYMDNDNNQYLYVEVLGQERASDYQYWRIR